jgi:RNA polymerase sigma factor (sigma-70 family)
MPTDESFVAFINRVRAGDTHAAAELCERYEPLIRTEVRLRLRDPRLRRHFDEFDICQSVLASFFVRVAAGQFDLDSPENLPRLLAVMARNKLAAQVRRQHAGRRDYRRVEPLGPGREAATAETSPSQAVAFGDLYREFRARLTPEERDLTEMRAQGRSWAEVASAMGGTPDARRVQVERAARRILHALSLESDDE